jgi:hypothetical protein
MRSFTITVEGVVRRRLTIEAADAVEAVDMARSEFCALTGADDEGLAIVDMQRGEDLS